MNSENTAYQQLMALDQAVMADMLEVTGAVTVSREAVNRHVREKTAVRAAQTDTGFRFWVQEEQQV